MYMCIVVPAIEPRQLRLAHDVFSFFYGIMSTYQCFDEMLIHHGQISGTQFVLYLTKAVPLFNGFLRYFSNFMIIL